MSYLSSKSALMQAIDNAWSAYAGRLDEIDPSLVEIPGPFGWSIKDVVANVAAWERGLIALIQGQPRFPAMAVEAAAELGEDIDAINELIYERARHRPYAEIRAEAEAIHAALRALLDRMPWEDFSTPVSSFQPRAMPNSAEPLLVYVAGDTYEHYEEHLPDLNAIVATAERAGGTANAEED